MNRFIRFKCSFFLPFCVLLCALLNVSTASAEEDDDRSFLIEESTAFPVLNIDSRDVLRIQRYIGPIRGQVPSRVSYVFNRQRAVLTLTVTPYNVSAKIALFKRPTSFIQMLKWVNNLDDDAKADYLIEPKQILTLPNGWITVQTEEFVSNSPIDEHGLFFTKSRIHFAAQGDFVHPSVVGIIAFSDSSYFLQESIVETNYPDDVF